MEAPSDQIERADWLNSQAMKMASDNLLRSVLKLQGKKLPQRLKTIQRAPRVSSKATKIDFAKIIEQARQEALTREGLAFQSVSDRILHAVSYAFDVSRTDLKGRQRARHLVVARAAVAKILRDQVWQDGTSRFSYPAIGRIIGGRDHSSIIHLVRSFDRYCEQLPRVRPCYELALTLFLESQDG